MTLGTPGGTRIISALAQIIMNVIDFHKSMDEAIEAPRVHCLGKVLHVESRIPIEIIEQLRSMGHTVKIHADFDNYFGGAQGILIDPKNRQALWRRRFKTGWGCYWFLGDLGFRVPGSEVDIGF